MYRIKILMEFANGIIKWVFTNGSLQKILYELALSKVVYGNKTFKNWPKSKEIIEYLEIAQNAIDKTMKFADVSLNSIEKEVKLINDSKSGPFKDTVAKVSKNKFGQSNHGIDLGVKTKINGKDIQLGVGFEGFKKINFGPFKIQL